ncbi:putative membrane protein C6F6.13c [Favolaschia claudopus]|uniref:Membrane protein C6F6.13c n=1 Tax=Favolaschia claudopus TaxID=2862362 RepID=A0AAW0B4N9_9AGAR
MADLTQLVPPKDLSDLDKQTVFDYFACRLRNTVHLAQLSAEQEYDLSSLKLQAKTARKHQFEQELKSWAQNLYEQTFVVCGEPGGTNKCPQLDFDADTSTARLPPLPPPEILSRILNTVLFLHIATTKTYSARTRTFLSMFGSFDEQLIVAALKNPNKAIEETQKQTQAAKEDHAKRGKTLRMVGIGLGAVAGGVLVGVTGGLAAPLVGAAASTILGILGVGGTAVGLLATGLASSAVICGSLFGVYGARTTSQMVERHTRELRDLAIVPVHKLHSDRETLAVRLCVSGWLTTEQDVVAPWTVFGGDDTFALQWEVELLKSLSDALMTLVKTKAMRYIQMEVIKRTVFASLMTSLLPIAWLKIGQIIDNDWMNSRALAVKAGAVLGDLLANRVFGNRPVTLTGYSLGSLVIFEALKHLATLPPSQTTHLIEDVFLFGTPAPIDPAVWASIRRLVSGRVVNGYSQDDYVLAVLSRLSHVSWGVAGLEQVDVMGVENVFCKDVDGHTKWRGMIGRSLQQCSAPGIIDAYVDQQAAETAELLESQLDAVELSQEEVDEIAKR